MKHLERLGSIAFLTITISLVFHLIAMSFNHWIENHCRNCNESEPLGTWYTSLKNRCYQEPVRSFFIPKNSSNSQLYLNSFLAEICIPDEILIAKNVDHAYECFLSSLNNPHTVCAVHNYDRKICRCDYTRRTKSVLATTILTAFSLGLMLFFSHIVSFTKLDYILRWLFPLCFFLLIFSIICILATLAIFAATIREDVNELVYSSSLLSVAFQNETVAKDWKEYFKGVRNFHYQTKVGWSYGIEILALQFVLVTFILYILMLLAKTRPETEN